MTYMIDTIGDLAVPPVPPIPGNPFPSLEQWLQQGQGGGGQVPVPPMPPIPNVVPAQQAPRENTIESVAPWFIIGALVGGIAAYALLRR